MLVLVGVTSVKGVLAEIRLSGVNRAWQALTLHVATKSCCTGTGAASRVRACTRCGCHVIVECWTSVLERIQCRGEVAEAGGPLTECLRF